MIDISRLSSQYCVRRMDDSDADAILRLCRENTLYYQYCGLEATEEAILNDLHITPPGVELSCKYYVGFFRDGSLAAVMDLIDGYPRADMAFIGFFMMNAALQGKGLGTGIVRDARGRELNLSGGKRRRKKSRDIFIGSRSRIMSFRRYVRETPEVFASSAKVAPAWYLSRMAATISSESPIISPFVMRNN